MPCVLSSSATGITAEELSRSSDRRAAIRDSHVCFEDVGGRKFICSIHAFWKAGCDMSPSVSSSIGFPLTSRNQIGGALSYFRRLAIAAEAAPPTPNLRIRQVGRSQYEFIGASVH